jgi:hypothetical protein
MKSIILILLASVVVSLFSGLFFLVKDRDSPDSTRMLTSLKIRVVLSICLVVLSTRADQLKSCLEKRPARRALTPYIQYTNTYRPIQTTSTKCQYQATASKAK